ncbi:MAG: hypothetical protein AAGF98_01955 [Cyanobacteria bacterium P01_H01_bin.153]
MNIAGQYCIHGSDANTLFYGRSGLTFHLQIPAGAVTSTVTTLDAPAQTTTQTVRDRQIIGVGSVGRETGKATYTDSPHSGYISGSPAPLLSKLSIPICSAIPEKWYYTLYSPYTNAVSFRTVRYGT